MKQLSHVWVSEMRERINGLSSPGATPIDLTTGENIVAKWLIASLSGKNVPFKVYNLGAGVKRITTDTDECPCCKRKMG